MKIGVIDYSECAVTVNCPDCGHALQKDESNTFWSDEYIAGLKGWCEHCNIEVLIPDLSTLKPINTVNMDKSQPGSIELQLSALQIDKLKAATEGNGEPPEQYALFAQVLLNEAINDLLTPIIGSGSD